MFLLDTNVVSELRRSDRANANVRAWALSQPAALFHVSVITVLEIERGILLAERRDARQGAMLRTWFSGVVASFADRILPMSVEIALRSAALHVPDPRPDRDAVIAATAFVHGLSVVTRNVSDFRIAGVAVLNPWDGANA